MFLGVGIVVCNSNSAVICKFAPGISPKKICKGFFEIFYSSNFILLSLIKDHEEIVDSIGLLGESVSKLMSSAKKVCIIKNKTFLSVVRLYA